MSTALAPLVAVWPLLFSCPEGDPVAQAGQRIDEARALFWYALAEHDDLASLEQALLLLEEARQLLPEDPEDARLPGLRSRLDALEDGLREQWVMGQDTLEGTFPLYAQLAFGLGHDVLFEDPSVQATVNSGQKLSDIVDRSWGPYGQLEFALRSSMRHEVQPSRASPQRVLALENELLFTLNQNPRLYAHTAEVLEEILGQEGLEDFQRGLAQAASTRLILERLDRERLLVIELQDEGSRPPLWYASAGGTLHARDAEVLGTLTAMGFARDRRDRFKWMVVLTVALLGMALAPSLLASRNPAEHLARGWLVRTPLLFVAGVAIAAVAARFLGRFLAPPERLLVETAWAPIALAAALGCGPVFSGALLQQRLKVFGLELPSHGHHWRLVWLPLALGGVAVLGWALLLERSPCEALVLSALITVGMTGAAWVYGRSVARPARTTWPELVACFLAWIVALLLLVARLGWSNLGLPALAWILALCLVAALGAIMCKLAEGAALRHVGGAAGLALGLLSALCALSADPWFCLAAAVGGAATFLLPHLFPQPKSRSAQESGSAAGEVAPEPGATLAERLKGVRAHRGRFIPWPGFEQAVEAAAEEMRPDRTGLVRIALRARAGAGKTRSARELLERLGVSERLSGTCRGEAFAPIGEMLGEKRAEAASEGLIEEAIRHLASLIPIPGIFAEPDASEEQGASRRAKALSELLSLESEVGHGRRKGMLFEQAEQLDGDSAAVLEKLFEQVQAQDPRDANRMQLVVVACCEAEAPRLQELGFEERSLDTSKFLRPFFEQTLGLSGDLSTQLSERIGSESALSALAHVEAAVGASLLDGEGTGAIEGPLDAERRRQLETLRSTGADSAARAQLEALPLRTRQLLACGALAESGFDLGVLASVYPKWDSLELAESLQIAVDAEVLEDRGENGGYRFCSEMHRAALREGSAHSQRALELHRRLAQHYIGQWEDGRRVPDLFSAASQAALAGESYRERALGLSCETVEQALRRGYGWKALEAAGWVLQQPEASADQRLCAHGARLASERVVHWVPRQRPLGSADEALADLGELSGAGGALRAELRLEIAERFCELGQAAERDLLAECLEQVERALELDSLVPAARVRALRLRGQAWWGMSRRRDSVGEQEVAELYRKALHAYGEALDVSLPGTADREYELQRAMVFNCRGEARDMSPGEIPQPEGAAKDYEQSLEIKRRIGDRPGCAITLGSRGRMYLYRGAGLRSQAPPEDSEDLLRRALDSFREDLELSEELGDVRGIIQMHSNTGLTLLKQGEFAEAVEHFSKSLGIASRLELPGQNDQIGNKSFALLGLVAAQAEQGELPAAEARWAELESLQGRDGLGRFLKGDVRKFFGPHAGSFLERVEVGSPPGA